MASRFYFLIIIFTISCGNSTSSTKLNSNKENNAVIEKTGLVTSGDTTGFFSNCQELMNHSSLGSLQGIAADEDSVKNLYFGDCFDYCKETFQIIFLHKDANKRENENYDLLRKDFGNGCMDYFENFKCFAFVCPRRDPDKQEDIHALNIDFPVRMRIYERISGDNWKFLKKITANTYEEYARIRFKTIYHLN